MLACSDWSRRWFISYIDICINVIGSLLVLDFWPSLVWCILSNIYICLESALHIIFQLWMSRNEGQSLCSHSINFDLLSKSFEIYLNHTTVSPQNFGKSPTHQKSPFLKEPILGNGLSVYSSSHIHKNSKISKLNEGMFMKF